MNIELNNMTENEVEYVDKTYTNNSKFKKLELLIFLGCIFFAFMMWCYANYIDDPIIQKEVNVVLELDGGKITEKISSDSTKLIIYGEESIISGVYEIRIDVDRNKFDEGNNKIKINPNDYLPDDVYTHKETIEVELTINQYR